MPVGTFKHKFNETNGKYRFTDEEKEKLLIILRELATDIELIAGIKPIVGLLLSMLYYLFFFVVLPT